MQPLTGGDTDLILGDDQWLLILVRRYFKKFRQRFPKSSILDIR